MRQYILNTDLPAGDAVAAYLHRAGFPAERQDIGTTSVFRVQGRRHAVIGAAYAAAVLTGESCIAMADVDCGVIHERLLVGPRAAEWGVFDNSKFILPRG